MDLNFCTICSRETGGSLYCGDSCRQQDLPAELSPSSPSSIFSSSSLSSSSNGGFSFSSNKADLHFRSYSGSSDEDGDRFVLPGRRNFQFVPEGSGAGLKRTDNFRLGGGAAPNFIRAQPRRALDSEDPELDFINRITQPLGFEHRQKHQEAVGDRELRKFERYIIRREFPAAF